MGEKDILGQPLSKLLNFLTWVAGRHYEDIRAELTAALTAERITTTVMLGGHFGDCFSAPH